MGEAVALCRRVSHQSRMVTIPGRVMVSEPYALEWRA